MHITNTPLLCNASVAFKPRNSSLPCNTWKTSNRSLVLTPCSYPCIDDRHAHNSCVWKQRLVRPKPHQPHCVYWACVIDALIAYNYKHCTMDHARTYVCVVGIVLRYLFFMQSGKVWYRLKLDSIAFFSIATFSDALTSVVLKVVACDKCALLCTVIQAVVTYVQLLVCTCEKSRADYLYV